MRKGSYTIEQVPPGFYKVTAKAPGFADLIVNRVELLVNEPATLDLKFAKVGSTTETVQVTASAVQVNTTDASLGNAIDTNAIIQMPCYARNVVSLLAFQPGVTSYSSNGIGRRRTMARSMAASPTKATSRSMART